MTQHLPPQMLQALAAAVMSRLGQVSSHIPPEAALTLWAPATKRPTVHIHGGPGLLVSRDSVPVEAREAIVSGLRGHVPDVALPMMGVILREMPRFGRPAAPPEGDVSDPARYVCEAMPRRIEGMFALANQLLRQLSAIADIRDDNPSGENCAWLLAAAVIITAGALGGLSHPTLDRDRATAELGIGLAMSMMRVISNLNTTRNYRPKPTISATVRRTTETTGVRVTDSSFLIRTAAGGAGKPPPNCDFSLNGLAVIAGHGIVVRTGTSEGIVLTTMSVLDQEPVADTERWSEVVDVSVTMSAPDLVIGEAKIALPGSGDYRVRIQARRRDAGLAEGSSGGEQFSIITWPAPAEPTHVWSLTDRLGHRLRGDVEPSPVVHPETAYRWVNDAFGEDGSVTMVTGMELHDVVRAFGGDPSRPLAGDVRSWPDRLVVGTIGDVVVAIQFAGWESSRPEVLRRVSAQGLAATSWWSITGATRFGLAKNGAVVDLFEDWSEATSPEVLDRMQDLDRYSYVDVIERGLVFAERVTGAALTLDFLNSLIDAEVSYEIIPWLPDHRVFVPGTDHTYGPLWQDKAFLLAATDGELREITWWAVGEMVRYGRAEDPDIGPTLASRTLSGAATLRARRAQVPSGPAKSGANAAWKAVFAATNPDPRAALVDVANMLTMPVSWQIDTLADLRQRLQAAGGA